MSTFEHPRWWRYSFWIGSPALAATFITGTAVWVYLSPLISAIVGAVSAACLVPLWNTARHIMRRVEVTEDALRVVPYLGSSHSFRWDDIRAIREFSILGWTARRQAVLLEMAHRNWVVFFHDIDRFDDLRAVVKVRATSADVKGPPPWWSRLLRLGTF